MTINQSIGFFSFLAFGLITSAAAAETPEKVAQAAAEQWLGLTDTGKYSESWKEAAPAFQSAITEVSWVAAISSVRKPLGSLISRKLKGAQHTKTLPGAPDGEYVILQFDTVFQNKKEAVETVTPMLDAAGKWKVSGYFVK